MQKFRSVPEMVARLRPLAPVHCFREFAVRRAVNSFTSSYDGKVLYAVKTNPEESVLRAIYDSGVTNFDVASLAEVRLVAGLLPDAKMHFMNAVKSRESIAEAYFEYGIRDFSLDTKDELTKILESTNSARDLSLHLRLYAASMHSEIDLSRKYGADPEDAVFLLQDLAHCAERIGICFHVGSQCMHPSAYGAAIRMAASIAETAEVKLDVIDVGGGFPSVYPGLEPPPLSTYFSTISKNYRDTGLSSNCELWCEPGRALVAEAGSVVVRVELRKGNCLYLNDGTYGALFDAGHPGFVFPVRLVRPGDDASGEMEEFSFFGPTCDGLDFMKGPFCLPADVREGDYLEVGQLGAYSVSMRTRFNGFNEYEIVEVDDLPMMSMYETETSLECEAA